MRRRLLRSPEVGTFARAELEVLADLETTSLAIRALAAEHVLKVVWCAVDLSAFSERRAEFEHMLAGLEVHWFLEPPEGYEAQAAGAFLRLVPEAREQAEAFSKRLTKRVLDLTLGTCLALIAAPFLIAIALLQRLVQGAPIWILQERAGRHGVAFGLLKFRTLRPISEPAERGAYAKPEPGDPRLGTLGRFLRRTSLDELPQLWNVLRGDMSLVGPRPELLAVARHYPAAVRPRLQVLPGLTGLWQISRARRRPIHEDLEYDFYYLRNRDVWLDLTILLLTPFAVLRGTGAR